MRDAGDHRGATTSRGMVGLRNSVHEDDRLHEHPSIEWRRKWGTSAKLVILLVRKIARRLPRCDFVKSVFDLSPQ
jgi:hypothetical protein